MKKYLVVLLAITVLAACGRLKNTNESENVRVGEMDIKRLESLKNDTSNIRLFAYNNIPISSRQETVDSILLKDSLSNVREYVVYNARKVKEFELSGFNSSNEYELLRFLGYGDLLDRYSIDEAKGMASVQFDLDCLKRSLRGAVGFGCLALDHYLDNSYVTTFVVEVDKAANKEFEELYGNVILHSHNDTVYSITCAIEKHWIGEYKKVDISTILNPLKKMLEEKYGEATTSDKCFVDYFLNCENMAWEDYEPKKVNRKMNITEAYSWLKGRYEIMLLVNHFSDSECEFLIRYIDNDFVFRNVKQMNETKVAEIEMKEEQKKQAEEMQQNKLKEKQQNQSF